METNKFSSFSQPEEELIVPDRDPLEDSETEEASIAEDDQVRNEPPKSKAAAAARIRPKSDAGIFVKVSLAAGGMFECGFCQLKLRLKSGIFSHIAEDHPGLKPVCFCQTDNCLLCSRRSINFEASSPKLLAKSGNKLHRAASTTSQSVIRQQNTTKPQNILAISDSGPTLLSTIKTENTSDSEPETSVATASATARETASSSATSDQPPAENSSTFNSDFFFDGSKYLCLVCDFSSKKGDRISLHMMTKHQVKVSRFSCSFCAKTFYNLYWFLKHEKVCATANSLTQFFQVVDGWFECQRCPFKSLSKTNTINHVKAVHLETKDFQCPNCLRKFSRIQNLNLHTKRFLNESGGLNCKKTVSVDSGERLGCSDDVTTASSGTSLERLDQPEPGSPKLKKKNEMAAGQKSKSKKPKMELNQSSSDPEKCQRFESKTCPGCQATFYNTGRLQNHLSLVTPTIESPTDFLCSKFTKQVAQNKDPIARLTCSRCDVISADRRSFYEHVGSCYTNWASPMGPNACIACDYTSKMKGHFQRHVAVVHEMFKEFQCDNCDKFFSSKRDLDDHRTRSSIDSDGSLERLSCKKPQVFVCDACRREFPSLKAGILHLRFCEAQLQNVARVHP